MVNLDLSVCTVLGGGCVRRCFAEVFVWFIRRRVPSNNSVATAWGGVVGESVEAEEARAGGEGGVGICAHGMFSVSWTGPSFVSRARLFCAERPLH